MFPYFVIVSLALGLLVGGPAEDPGAQPGVQPGIEAGGNACPKIYAPVICDNGKTYPNQCVADRHHAQNCVPTGEL